MALPRSLVAGNHNDGPWFSSAGACYVMGYASVAGQLVMRKSADPSTTAFAEVDAADKPTVAGGHIRGSTNAGGAVQAAGFQVGDVIHIACLSYTAPAMGDWEWYWDYFSFNMGTDQWDTSTIDSSVNATAFATNGVDVTTGQIRIMVRGNDGDIVIVGGGTADTVKGTDYSTIYHAFFNGSTWSTPTRIDTATAEVNYLDPTLSNDFTTDGDYTATWDGDATITGRAVTGASHTQESTGSLAGNVSSGTPTNIVYNDGGTWRGSVITHQSAQVLHAFRYDPTSATPFASETQESDITGADNISSTWGLQAYDSSTDTRYCIYVVAGAPASIKYVSSVNEAAWGGATTFSTPSNDIELRWGHGNVGTSPSDGSSTVIGFLYWDQAGTTLYYDEIVIAAGGAGVTPATGALSLVGIAPTTLIKTFATTATAALTFTGVAPTTKIVTTVTPATAQLTLTGVAPTLTIGTRAEIPAGTLTFDGVTPETHNVWGWNGAGAEGVLSVAFSTTTSARAGGGQFNVGATARITHLLYNWDTIGGAVRLGLYKNSTLVMDNATLLYDHGKVTPTSTGLNAYALSTPINVADGTFLWVVAKSDEPDIRIARSTTGARGNLTSLESETAGTESHDGDDPWDTTAPLSWGGASANVVAMGVYYDFAISETPSTASLTFTGVAPNVSIGTPVTTKTGALALTGVAPTLTFSQTETPSTGALTLTGVAPNLSIGFRETPKTGALVLTGATPTLTLGERLTIPTGVLGLVGATPRLSFGVSPSTAILSLAGAIPSLSFSQTETTKTASLVFTGVAPTLTVGAGATETPGTASLTFVGVAPRLAFGVVPATATLSLTGAIPTVLFSQSATPGTANLTLAGAAPSLTIGTTPAAGALTLAGASPSLLIGTTPPTGILSLTGAAPLLRLGTTPATGSLTLSGATPTLSYSQTLTIPTASLVFSGVQPVLGGTGISNLRKLIELYEILLSQSDWLLHVWYYYEVIRRYE